MRILPLVVFYMVIPAFQGHPHTKGRPQWLARIVTENAASRAPYQLWANQLGPSRSGHEADLALKYLPI